MNYQEDHAGQFARWLAKRMDDIVSACFKKTLDYQDMIVYGGEKGTPVKDRTAAQMERSAAGGKDRSPLHMED